MDTRVGRKKGSLNDPLKDNFKNYLWKTWRTLGLGDPSPLQYDFADYLQDRRSVAKGLGARKELLAFRGAAKTYVTTTYADWRLYRNQEEHVLVTSATAGFAKAISTFAFMMITTFDWLMHLAPRPDQRQAAQAFDVNGAPASKDTSLAAESIFGQITGRRASLIIGDDLETPNTSDTEGSRTELRKRIGEFGAIILPGGDIFYLGTPQVEDTIYKHNVEEKGYEARIYPITYPIVSADPKKDELRRYGPALAPIIRKALEANPELAGTSTEPVRFDESDIAARRIEWGATEFDRQFKLFLDAGVGRGNPLKMRDLIVLDIPRSNPPKLPSDLQYAPIPANALSNLKVDGMTGDSICYAPGVAGQWLPVEDTICWIDPSGEGTDETTWTIAATLMGYVALLWQGYSLDGHTPGTMMNIAIDCQAWGVGTVKVESNFGQGMFGELLKPVFHEIKHPVTILDERQGTQSKEQRIVTTMEPLSTAHRLIVNAEMLRRDFEVLYDHVEDGKRRYYRWTYQFSRMTTHRGCVAHDDRIDGSASAAKHFVGILQRALADAKKAGQEKLLEAEADAIIEQRIKSGLPLFGLGAHPTFGRRHDRTKIKLR